MSAQFPDLWIERKDREKCLGYAYATGIRVRYANGITEDLKNNLNDLIKYLRRRYFFPIRCNVIITNHPKYRAQEDGHTYYGVFYDNVNAYKKKKLYPEIYVAGKIDEHLPIEQVMFTLLHELSHYFQWFFDEEKQRSDRSLEMEATRWANRILEEYKQDCSLQTPFGELNIYVDDQLVNYLPVRITYDQPTNETQSLTACYRIYGAIKTGQTVRCVIEPLAQCDVNTESGENYLCRTFEKDTLQMTLGVVEHYDYRAGQQVKYQISPIQNGFTLMGLEQQSTMVLGLAWVNDYTEGDDRTYFAADPLQ